MASPIAGRWDMTQGAGMETFPSWLELTETPAGWEGRYVGIWGSSRPIASIAVEGTNLEFSLPTQYEGYKVPMVFKGSLQGEELSGVTNAQDGSERPWKAVRAPSLVRSGSPKFGEPISLITQGMSGWKARWPEADFNWSNVDGALVNSATGTDIVSEELFTDFKLEAEYSYPAESNSGIYLRGRYEFQVLDDYGQAPGFGSAGAIYGFFPPLVSAVKPHGEVNKVEITLIGRRLSATLNGQLIHDDVEIPGITGGALDSEEGAPGPILLQGDHGAVTYHKVIITPITF